MWDLETVPDLAGFAAAHDLVGKSDVEVRKAISDKFPKHIYHSIVCIGALRQGTFTTKSKNRRYALSSRDLHPSYSSNYRISKVIVGG